jgi:hypothetical protein
MRIVGATIVRNEADLIEAFVRHQLRLLDELLVIDHGSTDRTPAIVRQLGAEGLPVRLVHSSTLGFRQASELTRAIAGWHADSPFDACFALDADEFIAGHPVAAIDRDRFRQALLPLARTDAATLRWTTYLPPTPERRGLSHPLERMPLRLADEPRALRKVVLGRPLLDRSDWTLAPGNHGVVRVRSGGQAEPVQPVPLDALRLAHLPIRSSGQLAQKAVLGWLAHRLAFGELALRSNVNQHWRRVTDRIAAGQTLDDAALLQAALTLYADGGLDESTARQPQRVVTDPLPTTSLRHTAATEPDAFAALIHWTQGLVAGRPDAHREAPAPEAGASQADRQKQR